jgi:hypothetical protein
VWMVSGEGIGFGRRLGVSLHLGGVVGCVVLVASSLAESSWWHHQAM